jgi:hypothetical protein
MTEQWLPITGFEGRYSVSDQGRVRNDSTGRVLKPLVSKGNPYPRVFLGAGNQRYIHHLVAEEFIGPRPGGLDILHANDIPADCRASNLSYGTTSQNIADASSRGRLWQNRRAECPRKHPYDAENTYVFPGGKGRKCRACEREKYHENKPTPERKTA